MKVITAVPAAVNVQPRLVYSSSEASAKLPQHVPGLARIFGDGRRKGSSFTVVVVPPSDVAAVVEEEQRSLVPGIRRSRAGARLAAGQTTRYGLRPGPASVGGSRQVGPPPVSPERHRQTVGAAIDASMAPRLGRSICLFEGPQVWPSSSLR